jgi:hypothetical protein
MRRQRRGFVSGLRNFQALCTAVAIRGDFSQILLSFANSPVFLRLIPEVHATVSFA